MPVQVRVGPVVEDGVLVNIIWTHTDVTERAQEERLLELRNRALNYMSDGIFICDRQGLVLYTNQGFARLTGYEQKDAVGQPWTFLAVGSGWVSRLRAAQITCFRGVEAACIGCMPVHCGEGELGPYSRFESAQCAQSIQPCTHAGL